ncbi:MAG: hypothetical protein ACHQC8_06525 [Solirubrobacterales bacterium]
MRLGKGAKVGLALAALLLLVGGAAEAKGKLTVVTSTGPKRAKHSTYEGDASSWAKARYKLARDYFKTYWGTALDEAGVHDAALSVLAHWSLETGSGAAEYNFNVGNIRAVGSQTWFALGDYNPKTGGKGSYQFASYDSLQDGSDAYFHLLENSHYKAALDALVASPSDADWFRKLGQAGYYAATLKDPKTGAVKDNLEPAAKAWSSRRALMAQYAVDGVGDDTGPVFVVSDPNGAAVLNFDGSHAGHTLALGSRFEVNVSKSSDDLLALGRAIDGYTLGALVGRYIHEAQARPAGK